MVVARIIDPGSKLATSRGLDCKTCLSTLGELLDIVGATSYELYEAMDWLLERQTEVEQKLATKHLHNGASGRI